MNLHSRIVSSASILFILLISSAVVSAQTYGAQATAVRSTVNVVGNPVVTTAVTDTGPLPNAGGNISLTSVGVTLPLGVGSVGSSNSNASGVGNTASANASVNNVNIGVLSNTITADAVSSSVSSTCPGSISSGSSEITNLSINGSPITVTGAPNQTVAIFLLGEEVGTLIINEQIIEARGMTVNALHLFVTDPATLTTTDVVIASARSSINCVLAPSDNLYSGRAVGVNIFESDILSGTVSTIISDTGPLPMAGGTINVTTAGAGLSPLLSTGVATGFTFGGIVATVPTSESNASVNDLAIDAGGVLGITITANALVSNTECSCSLSVGSCSGTSSITGLTVTALGLPFAVTITGEPNQVVDVLGLATLTINEQFGSPNGNPADFTVNALRVDLNVVGLVGTSITVSSSHSDIVCSATVTSAGADVGGRVTDATGRGLRGVSIAMTGPGGETRTALTNGFGYYRFDNIPTGRSYILSPSSKLYTFEPRLVNIEGDLLGVDFMPAGPIGK